MFMNMQLQNLYVKENKNINVYLQNKAESSYIVN